MSTYIQLEGGIHPIFCSYLEGQLLIRAETLSHRQKRSDSPFAYLFIFPNRTEEVASFRRPLHTRENSFPLLGASFGPLLEEYRLPPEVHFLLTEESNPGHHQNTTRPLILFAAELSVSPIAPASDAAIIVHSTKNAPTRWTRYPWG